MSGRQLSDDEAGARASRQGPSILRSPSSTIRMIRQASSRRFLREPSVRVREAAEEQVEQRQNDLAYSWPVVLLDLVWNAGFVVASLFVLWFSVHENPSAPLRLWIYGYSAQCVVHMVCVWSEYQRRQELRRIAATAGVRRRRREGVEEESTVLTIEPLGQQSSEDGSLSEALLRQRRAQEGLGGAGGGEAERDEERGEGGEQERGQGEERESEEEEEEMGYLDGSVARQIESINTMFSFVWWVVGLGWLLSTFDNTFEDSPLLSWLCMIFLAFDVFFVIFCTALACVIGIAVCCCLPCIIAVLYAVRDNDGASPEAIQALPRLKFRRASRNSKQEEPSGTNSAEGTSSGGFFVPLAEQGQGDSARDRVVASDDAECCICLCSYEDGAVLRELPCGHHFDQSCLDKWLRTKPTCPLCKYDIVRKSRSGSSSENTPAPGEIANQPESEAEGGAQVPPSLLSTIRASAGGFFSGSSSPQSY